MANITLISATHDIDQTNIREGFSDVHTHENAELIFIFSGVVSFTVSEITYEAKAGDLIYVSKLEQHCSQLIDGPYDRYYIQASYDASGRDLHLSRLLTFFQCDPRRAGHVIHLGEYTDEVRAVFEHLCREHQTPGNHTEEYKYGHLVNLLSVLSRICPDRFFDKHNTWDQLMLSIQKYLDEHFTEPISVENIAHENFISPDYLARRFKQSTGYSPKQYICLNRLVYSKKLLMTGHLPISEVAYRSGFSDVNNFIRSFKKHFGQSPGRYRSIEMREAAEVSRAERRRQAMSEKEHSEK